MPDPAFPGPPARDPEAAPPSVRAAVPAPVPPDAPPPGSSSGALERLAATPVTYLLTAVNIGVFVWAEYFGGGTSNQSTLLDVGAVEPFHVWSGEYWRLVTCIFVHVGLVHLAVNTYMSLGWSPLLERAFGSWKFLLVYLLAGVGGSCSSVIVGFGNNPHTSAGASGALFGVVGATLALRRRQFPDLRTFLADRGLRSIALQIAILTVVGLTWLPLDNAAHLGGLVTGAAVGTLLTARAPRPGWLTLAAAFAVSLAAATRPWWSPDDGKDKDLVAGYASAYLTGNVGGKPDGVWHRNVARGTRIAEKGCAHRVAFACEVLALYLDSQGEPSTRARAGALHQRSCELEPPICDQLH